MHHAVHHAVHHRCPGAGDAPDQANPNLNPNPNPNQATHRIKHLEAQLVGITDKEARREASTRSILGRRVQQKAEAEAALCVLAADCRTLQQENVQLRLLGQSLGASSHALLRPRRQTPAPPTKQEPAQEQGQEAGQGENGGGDHGGGEGPLHSREALEERVRSVRRQFDDIRQQAASRGR